MPKPQSLLIVLDVQGVVDVGELKALLDQEPREVLRLSDFGGPPYSRESSPAWSVYGAAVEKLTTRVQQIEREVGRALDIYAGAARRSPCLRILGSVSSGSAGRRQSFTSTEARGSNSRCQRLPHRRRHGSSRTSQDSREQSGRAGERRSSSTLEDESQRPMRFERSSREWMSESQTSWNCVPRSRAP